MPPKVSPAPYFGVNEANKEFVKIHEETSKEGIKIKALSNELRRLILGLLYTNGPMYQSDILKHLEIKSNLLAYHLDILATADMVERKYSERRGQNFSLYSIKQEGEKFLALLGAKSRLDAIKEESKKQAPRLRNTYARKLQDGGHFVKDSKIKYDASKSGVELIALEDAERIVIKKYANLETMLNQVKHKLNLESPKDVHLNISETVTVLMSEGFLPEKGKMYFDTIMRIKNAVANGEPITESEIGDYTIAISWFEFCLENIDISNKN